MPPPCLPYLRPKLLNWPFVSILALRMPWLYRSNPSAFCKMAARRPRNGARATSVAESCNSLLKANGGEKEEWWGLSPRRESCRRVVIIPSPGEPQGVLQRTPGSEDPSTPCGSPGRGARSAGVEEGSDSRGAFTRRASPCTRGALFAPDDIVPVSDGGRARRGSAGVKTFPRR